MAWDQIGGAITSVNATIELVKAISSASGAMEKAELKLKAADVITTLADVKLALVDSREELRAREAEIAELQAALELKGNVVKHFDAIYLVDQKGDPSGDPYCVKCYQDKSLLRSLVKGDRADSFTHCATCKGQFYRARTPFRVGGTDTE